ncbi:hypothetical protein DI09_197p10 [Mitosporidium daphniae]|uniref:Ubiquitin conjugation factor E4 core domain-containing protein n=1 Tax=Mitosporidium daphniae TaxID=1485682 RepID=A0A098VTH2_9MICR|nr:uncharacterized protein DI09_197p10 [Mitosporidium daphniae]KGG52265.1 hypothetical protein DI09_197p10 [Mitosporidium daphniae]|eukprot:XP_013238701.1 uncharacterized protein DI09_197p10 [Mitosporidium daphniae]
MTSSADVNDLIVDIFQASIVAGSTKFFLKELSDELKQDNICVLSFSHVERILIEYLSSNCNCQSLLYLYSCFERVSGKKLPEVENLIFRYGSLVLENPTLFNDIPLNTMSAMQLPLMAVFIDKVVKATEEKDRDALFATMVRSWIVSGFFELGTSLTGKKMAKLFEFASKLINCFNKPLFFANFVLPESAAIDEKNVYLLERDRFFLATMLSRGPLNGNLVRLSQTETPDPLEYKNYIDRIHFFVKGLLSDPGHRPAILSYFTSLLLANHNKSKLQYDINLISAINSKFISQELSNEGKIATSSPLDSFSFINTSFLITLRSIRLGVIPLIRYFELLSKANSDLDPAQRTENAGQRLKQAQSSAIFYLSNRECFLEPLGQFYKFSVQWFAFAISKKKQDSADDEASISATSRAIFLEDLLEILVWISGTSAASLENQHAAWTMTLLNTFRPLLLEESFGSLIITCLEGKVISNPHLISKWIEFLYWSFEAMENDIGSFIYGAFKDLRQFMISLIRFWTEIETKAGRESAAFFYERFSIRYQRRPFLIDTA